MNRNEQCSPHWNLNRNYTKWHGAENTLGNTRKPKSIHTAYRKSHTKIREKYQFYCNHIRCAAVSYMKSLHWNLNDGIFQG